MVSVFVVGDNAHLMQRVMQLLEVKSYDSINYVNGLLVVNSETITEAFIKNKVKDMGFQQMYDATVEPTNFTVKVKVLDYQTAICLLNGVVSFRDDNTVEKLEFKTIDGDSLNILI